MGISLSFSPPPYEGRWSVPVPSQRSFFSRQKISNVPYSVDQRASFPLTKTKVTISFFTATSFVLTRFITVPQLQQAVHPSALDLDQESSAGRSDSEDDYVQQKTPAGVAVGKATKKKVSRRRPQEGEHARVAKKRKRKHPVEVDLSELPPEQGQPFPLLLAQILISFLANKIRLDMKIDEILRSKKPSRPRKKKSPSSAEVLDSFADDEVARLRESMNNAVDEDMRANQEKLPALAKLRMLREVVDTLRKSVPHFLPKYKFITSSSINL